MRRLFKPKDGQILIWFGLAAFAFYRYAWERPLSVAVSVVICGGLLYAGILIALNERDRQRKMRHKDGSPRSAHKKLYYTSIISEQEEKCQ